MKKRTLSRLGIGACLLLIIATLNLAPFLSPPAKLNYTLGETVSKDLYAPISFRLPKDPKILNAERDSAEALVTPVLKLDEGTERSILKNLRNLRFPDSVPKDFSYQTKEALITPGRDIILSSAESLFVSVISQGYFFEKDDPEYSTIKNVIIQMGKNGKEFAERTENLLGPSDIDTLTTNAARRLFPSDPIRREALTEIMLRILVPNLSVDEDEISARKQTARNRINPYEGFVERGELLLEQNSRVDELALKKIKALNSAIEGNWQIRLELFLRQNILSILVILIFVFSLYILRKDPPFKNVLFMTILLVASFVVAFAVRRFSIWWFVPVGFIALAVGIFLSPLEGILVATGTSLLLYIPWQTEPEYFLFALLSGFGALAAIPFMGRRMGFLATFGFIGIGGLLARGGFLIAKTGVSPRELFSIVSSIGINAAGNLVFFMLAFFLAERLFGYTSVLTLSELANLNNHLFKEFSMRAAGSYHHSIVVGNLAESAARIISANPALALTGGYYHDIGKMTKPQYFIENQIEQGNPHDTLKPRISALILASHVKEGLSIAERKNLPLSIRKIIAEHHGTTRMESFYHKYLENPGEDDLSESDFRYNGPKPQSKEAALVMLADSVEAAVRSKGFADREELDSLVKEIIDQKVRDGQLDECNFTTSDIQKVRRIFVIRLTGIFHPRINYEKQNNDKGAEKDAKKRTPRAYPKSTKS